ncbi:hypothetical protein [Aquimarina sp. MMG016]|uniref:hypothetical protein n=1 Tax=Aquimarina sp. MMG016 TaxID=2822690 RepID=UPI001B3A7431|nr:hypothetical protein [Aquimarina sp. MMG016]
MKTIHNINKWSFIITLLLYLTIYFGLLAQILLGSVQIILVLILLYYWKDFQTKQKQHLAIYVGIVIFYGLLFLTNVLKSYFLIFFITVVPMSIAGYFVYITYLISISEIITNTLEIKNI